MSIPLWTDTWKPDSFVEKIERNLSRGLHTLCLLGKKESVGLFLFPMNLYKILVSRYQSEGTFIGAHDEVCRCGYHFTLLHLLAIMFFYRGKKVYSPPHFMSVAEAAQQMLEVIESRKQHEPLKCG